MYVIYLKMPGFTISSSFVQARLWQYRNILFRSYTINRKYNLQIQDRPLLCIVEIQTGYWTQQPHFAVQVVLRQFVVTVSAKFDYQLQVQIGLVSHLWFLEYWKFRLYLFGQNGQEILVYKLIVYRVLKFQKKSVRKFLGGCIY